MPEPEPSPVPTPGRLPGPLLIDAHVHLRRCFEEEAFLDGAAGNVRREAVELGLERATGCLLFAETPEARAFDRLRARAGAGAPGGRGARPGPGKWRIEPTGEEISLLARGPDGDLLLLMAGRQVVSAEGVEVLALGTGTCLPSGLPLGDMVERVLAAGALAVLPWGFGKWWGGRGRAVRRLLDAPPPAGFFLGDNAGRPRPGPASPLFDRARRSGVATLPGSDPLPLASEVGAAGRYGCALRVDLAADRPAADLKARLRAASSAELAPYGRRSGLPRFLRDQAAIRLPGREGCR